MESEQERNRIECGTGTPIAHQNSRFSSICDSPACKGEGGAEGAGRGSCLPLPYPRGSTLGSGPEGRLSPLQGEVTTVRRPVIAERPDHPHTGASARRVVHQNLHRTPPPPTPPAATR